MIESEREHMETQERDTSPTLSRLRASISNVDNQLLASLGMMGTAWEMANVQGETIEPFMKLSSFSLYASSLRDVNETIRERYRYTNLVGFVKFQLRSKDDGGNFAKPTIPSNLKFRYPPVKNDNYFEAALTANIPDELEEIFGVTFPDRETKVISRLQHRLADGESGYLTPEFVAVFWKSLFKISRVAQVITIMELQQRQQQFDHGSATV